jgi:hypothetical protein
MASLGMKDFEKGNNLNIDLAYFSTTSMSHLRVLTDDRLDIEEKLVMTLLCHVGNDHEDGYDCYDYGTFSTKVLSRNLTLSVNTVLNAYDTLQKFGYINITGTVEKTRAVVNLSNLLIARMEES